MNDVERLLNDYKIVGKMFEKYKEKVERRNNMPNLNLRIDNDMEKFLVKKEEKEPMPPFFNAGVRYRFEFPNGWGLSVIKMFGSYGYEEDLWEVGVLLHGSLHYENPIAQGDVVADCTDDEVNRYISKVFKWEPDQRFPEWEEEYE